MIHWLLFSIHQGSIMKYPYNSIHPVQSSCSSMALRKNFRTGGGFRKKSMLLKEKLQHVDGLREAGKGWGAVRRTQKRLRRVPLQGQIELHDITAVQGLGFRDHHDQCKCCVASPISDKFSGARSQASRHPFVTKYSLENT